MWINDESRQHAAHPRTVHDTGNRRPGPAPDATPWVSVPAMLGVRVQAAPRPREGMLPPVVGRSIAPA